MRLRLDELLVLRELCDTRSRAKQLILGAKVCIEGDIISKPSKTFDKDVAISIEDEVFVNRAASKLLAALENFEIETKGKVVGDIGASTGGFTEVLLKYGAGKVYAIDVGHGQLARKLRDDARVVNMEGVNARDPIDLPEKLDFLVIDLSYISLKLVLENLVALLKEGGFMVALVKPQFEVGPGVVGKDGVVKEEGKTQEVVEDLKNWLESNKFLASRFINSPIKGKKGNKEYLVKITPQQFLQE